MASHDQAYKALFSHPRMVRDLVVGFVRGTARTPLDLRSLEKCNTHFITDSLRSRTSDLVWRIRADASSVVYLLMEFQSAPDSLMPVRVLTYLGLLYQDLIKSGRMSHRQLQPILPVVLYCGERKWNAATSLRAISRMPREFPKGFRPHVRYQLIDIRRLRLDAPELKHNLAAALFRIENSRSRCEIDENMQSLLEAVGSGPASLRRAFDVWIKRVVLPRVKGGGSIGNLVSLEERRNMLSETYAKWEAEWLRQGQREGMRNGMRKGMRDGVATLLLEQLRIRFGRELPRWATREVEKATSAQLKRWGRRVLKAGSLHELLRRKRRVLRKGPSVGAPARGAENRPAGAER